MTPPVSQSERDAVLEEALRENLALRCLQGGGCDANNDGPHETIVGKGRERFCAECGEMVDAKGRSTPWFHGGRLERAKARIEAALTTPTPAVSTEEIVAAFERIAQPLDCGCRPCRGQCRSETALMCEVEERQDIARTILSRIKGGE